MIDNTTKQYLENLITQYQPVGLRYCSTVLPNSYKYAKKVPWMILSGSELKEISDYAKKAPYGSATHYWISVAPEHIEALKNDGWRLINRNRGELVK